MEPNHEKIKEEVMIDLSKLPQSNDGWFREGQILYQDHWYTLQTCQNMILFQQKFQPQDQDIILASYPKSGTTWMKALLFSIINRNLYNPSNTPLLTSNPHDLVPFFESTLFTDPPKLDISKISSPRLFSTHISYMSLPKHVVSKSRIIYICRNPLDTIASFWHFMPWYSSCVDRLWTIEDCVEAFCKGESTRGPFWDHVLEFWRASLENPEMILFMKFEDLLEDTALNVKRIAEFVGFPFSEKEERNGVVEQIVELCCLKHLKKLDVNKSGKLENLDGEAGPHIFFRKGEVGDWVNLLTPSMVESVKKVVDEKLSGSGLAFKYKL